MQINRDFSFARLEPFTAAPLDHTKAGKLADIVARRDVLTADGALDTPTIQSAKKDDEWPAYTVQGLGQRIWNFLTGDGLKDFFKDAREFIKNLPGHIWDGMKWLGEKLADGIRVVGAAGAWLGGKVADGVIAAGKAIGGAAKAVGSFIGSLF